MEDNKPKVLIKNNIIVKAKYNLNIIENRIFQLILYKAQLSKDTDTLKCKINHNEFKEIIKKRNDVTIKAIGQTLEKLRINAIEIMTNSKWYRYGFINGFNYDANTNVFEIKMDAEIYKLLFDYLKGYTPVNLAIFFSFKTFYTQRFYELLRLWSNTKQVINYSLEELKDLLMLEEQYSEYGNFKRRVILPTIKELNEKSLMNVEVKENKINRKVVSIDFIVSDSDKRKYFEEGKEENKNNKPIPDAKQNYNKGKELKFKNFDEREYDYDKIERQLLGWDKD